jgi:hypothetical protein
VGLERGPLSLVSTTEELLERKSRGSGLETENMDLGIRPADHVAKFGTNFTDKRRSLGLVRSRTQATEYSFNLIFKFLYLYLNI